VCFVLYGGTNRHLPRKAWRSNAPDLSVRPLTEHENLIKANFSKPEVQYIGSTSGCGCDFPHVMFQNGQWPWFDDGEGDAEQETSERYNREALASLLQASGEPAVELYGVWDGDFATPLQAREEISLKTLNEPTFRFKEQGFYVVRLEGD
jgi:hypothetical protein